VATGLVEALEAPDTQLRWFGKPEIAGKRRMGVMLALDETTDAAREKARRAAAHVHLI
jgi:phosphoribosylglycinamide formyltransferase 2